jgi:hypothetical protein
MSSIIQAHLRSCSLCLLLIDNFLSLINHSTLLHVATDNHHCILVPRLHHEQGGPLQRNTKVQAMVAMAHHPGYQCYYHIGALGYSKKRCRY